MKPNRSRLWIIILGGMIGLVLGAVIPYLLIQTGWKRLSYTGIDPVTDRAMRVVGYNYQDDLLYIKGRSQKTYECSVSNWSAASKCRDATDDAIIRARSLPQCWPVTRPTQQPPGRVISRLDTVYCPNEYQTLQFIHALLDDGSLWQLTDFGIDFDGALRYTCAPLGAALGFVMGALIGALIFGSTRTTSKT